VTTAVKLQEPNPDTLALGAAGMVAPARSTAVGDDVRLPPQLLLPVPVTVRLAGMLSVNVTPERVDRLKLRKVIPGGVACWQLRRHKRLPTCAPR
jgi:hypothetical protein